MPLPRLEWGLAEAVPEDAVAAWGARAIVNQDGYVDLVPDRIDRKGTLAIFDRLNAEYPLVELRDALRDLLASGLMNTRVHSEPWVLYQSDTLTVVADTRGSAGYCYLAAWTTVPPDVTPDGGEKGAV